MNKNTAGFVLLEAILTVVIVSICLTFIVQALLTNFQTGVRFQETVRSFLVMENRLGVLYATNASADQLVSTPQNVDEPYDKFTSSIRMDNINDHLKLLDLTINWPGGRRQGQLDVTTILYDPNGIKASS